MTLFEAILLGLVQGLTEFLPVSSSGHLVMGQALLDIRVPGVAFEIAVHVATLLSVILVFRRRIGSLLAGLAKRDADAWRYAGLLVLATLPAVIVGLGAKDALEALFEAPHVAGIGLLVTGSFLWTAKGAVGRDPSGMPGAKVAAVMGLAQAFAIVPGISRSGATVVAGLWLGVDAEETATFSFLMAVPAILGAAVLQLPELLGDPDGPAVGISAVAGVEGHLGSAPLLLGGLVAAVAGILAIRTFVAMLKRKSFHRFAPYCWAVGCLFLGYLFLRG